MDEPRDASETWLEPGRPLHPGDRVGAYVLDHRVGVGGMAEVWQARHEKLGTVHALKVLVRASETLAERLHLEGRAARRFDHPHLVPVQDILDAGGVPALLMPLVRGPSLAALIRAHPPSRAEALALFASVLDGVEHAHALGMVHRDLKPANVLLDLADGRVQARVADFGLVKDLVGTQHTRAGAVMGTPAYAAPEQLRDASRVDQRADLYSLGVLWVELRTGRLPFAGTTLSAIQAQRVQGPDLSGLDGADRALAEALLAEDPDERIATVGLARDRLGAVDLEVLGPSGTLFAACTAAVGAAPGGSDSTLVLPTGMHSIPRPRDAFHGRELAVAGLEAWVRSGSTRLRTVTGLGGTGKTRLAVHVARSVADAGFEVRFADLSEVTDAAGIVRTVAQALQVPVGADPVTQLGHALEATGVRLLVLDNLEQLVAYAPSTVGRWLDLAPGLKILATSRAPLGLRGEEVDPLDVVELDAGVALFADRARLVNPRFEVDDTNRAGVEALVELLDRLPLAIELAAARSRMQSPARLAAALERRLDVLASRSREIPERQRTLRATLNGSWELLTDEERAAFAQLGVFEGLFTIAAAEAVLELADFGDPWVEDVLGSLVDQGLVRLPRSGEHARLLLLRSVRAFAREQLDAVDPAAPAGPVFTRDRHARFYAGPGPFELDPLDNRTAAARFATDADAVTSCALAVGRTHAMRGPYEAGRELLEAVLAREDLVRTGVHESALHVQAGALCTRLGDPAAAERHFEAALAAGGPRGRALIGLALSERAWDDPDAATDRVERALGVLHVEGDRDGELEALLDVCAHLTQHGRGHAAEALATRALALASGGPLEGRALANVGRIARLLGRTDAAVDAHERALVHFRRTGDLDGERFSLLQLSVLCFQRGDDARGLELEAAGLRVSERLGHRNSVGVIVGNRATWHLEHGDLDAAREALERALAIHRATGHRYPQVYWLLGLGRVAADPTEAEARFREAIALGEPFPEPRGLAHRALAGLLRDSGRLVEAEAELAAAAACWRSIGDRGDYAAVVRERADLLDLLGRPADAEAVRAELSG
ncbi:MAG: protein kinase [Myxococcota bacterium]